MREEEEEEEEPEQSSQDAQSGSHGNEMLKIMFSKACKKRYFQKRLGEKCQV